MTIAKTSNAYDVNDTYGTQGATGTNYDPQTWAVHTVAHPGVIDWDEDGSGFLRAKLGICVTVEDITDPIVTINAESGQFNITEETPVDTTYAAEWITASDVAAGYLKQPYDLVSGGTDMPRKMIASFALTGEEFGNGVTDVHGLALIEQHQTDDPTDAEIEAFELPAVHDESGSIAADEVTAFDALMPVSAYLMKRLIAKNSNAIGYRTLQVINFPIVGVGSTL